MPPQAAANELRDVDHRSNNDEHKENGERGVEDVVDALLQKQLVVGDTTNTRAEGSGSQTAQGGRQNATSDADKLVMRHGVAKWCMCA